MLTWLIIPLFAVRADSVTISQQNYAPARITAQSVPAEDPPLEAECSAPESRWQRHRIAPGETIDSIAKSYGLLPETLIGLNPFLDSPSVGTEILIPPVDGVRVEVPAGTTWQDLEATYGIRADVLFELNSCQKLPTAVFLPGVNWGSGQGASDNYTGLSGYPLSAIAPVGLSYGWHSDEQQDLFHSGIDLLADPGTPVLAAEAGTVVYVGQEETYGNLIVVDHPQGRQTRYAHLDNTEVAVGEQVQAGDPIGTVGQTGQPDIATPHLHFEVRYNSPLGWIAQDPEIHLNIGSRFEF